MKSKLILLTAILTSAIMGSATPSFAQDRALVQAAGQIPVQHNGRIKSLDVVARETLRFLSGKERWEKQSAASFALNIISGKKEGLSVACIRVDYPELKKTLNLPDEKKYFSYEEIKPGFSTITALVESAQQKRDGDLRPTALEQKAENLYGQLMILQQLYSGELIKAIPPQDDKHAAWLSLAEVPADDPLIQEFRKVMEAYVSGSIPAFTQLASQWNQKMQKLTGENFALMKWEEFYYIFKPFLYSWIFYLLAFIYLLFFQDHTWLRRAGVWALIAGFVLHTAGLLIRAVVLGRVPVSNMYESMLFMNWILIICAFAFFLKNQRYFFLTTGALVSALVMIYANLLPIEKSLDLLAPVLKSNYWLTLHVMTIVASYGLFGLAMAIAHRHLFLDALKRFSPRAEVISATSLLGLMQIGLVTLGAGTILGGVWANESWGRFWGWDPKETWALITFLGYLAVIHLRLTGKLSNLMLALCAVLGFLLVLMTWYGVNFLLGRGLHSYGSGSGGGIWIVLYLIFEILFLIWFGLQKIKQA